MDAQELAATLQSVSQEKEKVQQRNAVLEKIVTMQIPPESSVSSPTICSPEAANVHEQTSAAKSCCRMSSQLQHPPTSSSSFLRRGCAALDQRNGSLHCSRTWTVVILPGRQPALTGPDSPQWWQCPTSLSLNVMSGADTSSG